MTLKHCHVWPLNNNNLNEIKIVDFVLKYQLKSSNLLVHLFLQIFIHLINIVADNRL